MSDRAAAQFARALYEALFAGASVRSAFQAALAHLRRLAADARTTVDAELANEARKFVLLPLDERATLHDRAVFDSPPVADASSTRSSAADDACPALPRSHFAQAAHLPALPAAFGERLIETHRLLARLTPPTRLVSVRGAPGVGKSTVALAAARYAA